MHNGGLPRAVSIHLDLVSRRIARSLAWARGLRLEGATTSNAFCHLSSFSDIHKSQPILSRFSVCSHPGLLVILVIRVRPAEEGDPIGAGTERIKMSRLRSC
jgi:hypothetical protein